MSDIQDEVFEQDDEILEDEVVEDDDEPVVEDDDDPIDDEDIVPEPPKVYSLVPCTGQRSCYGFSDCPKEGEPLYGQDANYVIRKSCVPQSFEELGEEDFDQDVYYPQTKDNNTGLTWLFTRVSGTLDDVVAETPEGNITLSEFCDKLDYDGHDDWRLPTPKEFLTITDADFNEYRAVRALYFSYISEHIDFILWYAIKRIVVNIKIT